MLLSYRNAIVKYELVYDVIILVVDNDVTQIVNSKICHTTPAVLRYQTGHRSTNGHASVQVSDVNFRLCGTRLQHRQHWTSAPAGGARRKVHLAPLKFRTLEFSLAPLAHA